MINDERVGIEKEIKLPLASKDPTIAPNTNEALSFFKKGKLLKRVGWR